MKQAVAKKQHKLNTGPARSLPGFEAIKHYWDSTHKKHAARILPGEYYVSIDDEVIVTILGSCISACIRDRKAGIGGMNHFMLPDDNGGIEKGTKCVSTATRYGAFAMEHMINDIIKNGGCRENLEIKLFGGGRMMKSMMDVGAKNIAFIREYIGNEQMSIASEDLGGEHPRKVYYFPQTGRVLLRKMPVQQRNDDVIISQERQYQASLQQKPVAGDIDLF